MKTVIESKMVTPRVNFSPESGGRANPRRVIDDIRTQGTIRLKV